MRLDSRLKWLEKRVAPPAPTHCGTCGLPLPGMSWKDVQLKVVSYSPGEPEKPPCPACGQKSEMRIEFDRAG